MITMYKLLFLTLIIFTLLIPGGSCKKNPDQETITLPPTSVLSIRSTWGVVTSNFLRLRERPSKQSRMLTGIPRGMIVEIVSKTEEKVTIEDKNDYWYHVVFNGNRGWVFGAYVLIFNSQKDAKVYAQGLL
jgi:uncharacterized protein YgiM (DUF1202 family)